MTDDDWFAHEPKDNPLHTFVSKNGTAMEMLNGYKPKTTEELAEWLMIAGSNLVDKDGLRILNPIKPYMAYQIASMMQIAKLKVPQ